MPGSQLPPSNGISILEEEESSAPINEQPQSRLNAAQGQTDRQQPEAGANDQVAGAAHDADADYDDTESEIDAYCDTDYTARLEVLLEGFSEEEKSALVMFEQFQEEFRHDRLRERVKAWAEDVSVIDTTAPDDLSDTSMPNLVPSGPPSVACDPTKKVDTPKEEERAP